MGETVQANGQDGKTGAADGVGTTDTHGKQGGGESQGGTYPNPQTGKDGKGGHTHGGQTDITYHGGGAPDGEAPNAATGGD